MEIVFSSSMNFAIIFECCKTPNGPELTCVQTFQCVVNIFKSPTTSRIVYRVLIFQYSNLRRVGGLHVRLSDWLYRLVFVFNGGGKFFVFAFALALARSTLFCKLWWCGGSCGLRKSSRSGRCSPNLSQNRAGNSRFTRLLSVIHRLLRNHVSMFQTRMGLLSESSSEGYMPP